MIPSWAISFVGTSGALTPVMTKTIHTRLGDLIATLLDVSSEYYADHERAVLATQASLKHLLGKAGGYSGETSSGLRAA
jgi:hypothetical protein